MISIIIIVLGIIMIVAAFLAIHLKNLLSAVISAGVISLLASVIYLLLAAPDVAMTEAAIGSGLTTIIFIFTLKKIKKGDLDD
ncbi:MAG: hydrogenase subunit MbhD domain-containing protein [Candidatus Cloacimonadota bacterium]|nr:hydrogenase subunit MbhD domain-containing protein [Candidatus Cloacimonadota bacterium]